MDQTEATTRLLDAAESLFYARGVHSVGMDEIRAASGVSLKRLYQCFPSKDDLVLGYLRRRDERWRSRMTAFADQRPTSAERALAVFDWLHEWFSEPGFRGCAFINSFGELGATTPAVTDIVRHHKDMIRDYLAALVPAPLADQLLLLIDGAITSAAITGNPDAARIAYDAAATLLRAAETE